MVGYDVSGSRSLFEAGVSKCSWELSIKDNDLDVAEEYLHFDEPMTAHDSAG